MSDVMTTTAFYVRNVHGNYLIRDNEFTSNIEDACAFKSRADAQNALMVGETVVELPATTQLVFVYGTLKQGYGNSHRCLARSKFLGEALSFDANYRMRGDGVPFLSWGGTAKVKGELFEVSPEDFARCDSLEGHPHAYKREQRLFVLCQSGRFMGPYKAWVYLWPSERGNQVSRTELKPVHGILEWRRDHVG